MTVSERLKSERNRLGLTQEQLANRLGTSRSNVANWESGQNRPGIEMFIKCSDLFGCTVEYLTGYSDNRNVGVPVNEQFDDYDIPENKDWNKWDFEFEMLFQKYKDILTDDDKEYIKFIFERRKKELENKKED